MDEINARAVTSWQYEAPYDVYNVHPALAEKAVQEYLLPENAYYSAHTGKHEFIGYCCFGQDARVPDGDYPDDALDVGLGLRPDLTGNGYGREFVQAILTFGMRHYAPRAFRMTVARFNQRAIQLYKQLGFKPLWEFYRQSDVQPFIVMKLEHLPAFLSQNLA